MKALGIACAAACALAVCATDASAAFDQVWRLNSHPDGNAADPIYGMRLDGLGGHSPVTIDFDTGFVSLAYDNVAKQIRIVGTALGGHDIGSTYDPSTAFTFEFLYDNVTEIASGTSLELVVNSATMFPGNSGSVTPLEDFGTLTGGVPVALSDKSNGTFSFKFDNVDNHRLGGHGLSGPDTFVGRGWFDRSGTNDFLFIGTKDPNLTVPEPTSIAMWSIFGVTAAGLRLRKKRSA